MTSDDLEARKADLEDWIDGLGAWMIGFVWPVAVGLVIEFYALLGLSLTANWNVFIDRIGLLLVTGGVIGELVIEHKTHTAERKLRGVNSQIEHKADLALKAADERIALLDRDTAEARRETAKLQLQLQSVSHQARGRRLSDMFGPSLEGKPKGSVELWYVHGDHEAHVFALQMWHALQKAGWTAPQPVPIPPPAEQHNVLSCIPHQNTWGQLTLFAKTLSILPYENNAVGALSEAITVAVGGGFNTGWGGITCPILADDVFVIIIGQK